MPAKRRTPDNARLDRIVAEARQRQEARAQTYRERLMEEVAEVSDELLERYLEGEEISHEEIVEALGRGTNHGSIFPVVCGVATRNLGTNRNLILQDGTQEFVDVLAKLQAGVPDS